MTRARYIMACRRGRVRDRPYVGFFACFHAISLERSRLIAMLISMLFTTRVEPIMLIFLPIILFRNSRKSFLLFLLAAPIIPFELASAKPLRKKGGV